MLRAGTLHAHAAVLNVCQSASPAGALLHCARHDTAQARVRCHTLHARAAAGLRARGAGAGHAALGAAEEVAGGHARGLVRAPALLQRRRARRAHVRLGQAGTLAAPGARACDGAGVPSAPRVWSWRCHCRSFAARVCSLLSGTLSKHRAAERLAALPPACLLSTRCRFACALALRCGWTASSSSRCTRWWASRRRSCAGCSAAWARAACGRRSSGWPGGWPWRGRA